MSNLEFGKKLLLWYRKYGRHNLPWRHTKDPYHILVSEIMLQQTRVDRVIPKYKTFLKKFPTLRKLGGASAASVLRAWQGMGYNRRALYLKNAAEICVRSFSGKVPNTYEALRTLPGVGDYTARAVLCFAFGQDGAFYDTNIRRIFSRVYFGKNPSAVGEGKVVRVIEGAVHTSPNPSSKRRGNPLLLEGGAGWGVSSFAYHSALMDFGSLVCRTNPLCSICPMQKFCKAAPKVLAEGDGALEGRVVRHPQSKFEGSNRKIRGLIVELLRQKKNAKIKEFAKLLSCEMAGLREMRAFQKRGTKTRLKKILSGLIRDGLITKKGSMYALPR